MQVRILSRLSLNIALVSQLDNGLPSKHNNAGSNPAVGAKYVTAVHIGNGYYHCRQRSYSTERCGRIQCPATQILAKRLRLKRSDILGSTPRWGTKIYAYKYLYDTYTIGKYMIKNTEQEIINAIKENPLSMRQAALSIEMKYTTFIRKAKQLGIYNPNQGGKGLPKPAHRDKGIPLKEILEGKHPQYQTNKLRIRLIRDGLKENRCEECNNDTWNGKPIAIELDHIDGVSNNHKFENLKILCCNCHAQTTTWRGRNKKESNAAVAKLAYAAGLSPAVLGHVGSTPTSRTKKK